MNELEVKRVPFMGTDLMAAKDESGTIWAGVRWMCDGMGLSKGQRDRQITNINADSVISKGAANLQLPTAGGTSRHRVISRSQLARQIAELAMYQPE